MGTSGQFSKGKKSSKAPAEKDFAEFDGQQMEGEVTSFKGQWGWVACPSFSSDLFAHVDDLAPGLKSLKVGDTVSFTVGQKDDGKWRALDITVTGEAPPKKQKVGAAPKRGPEKGYEKVEGQVLEGTVVAWKDKWGWVNAGEGFDGGLFAHIDDVVEGQLSKNCAVSFTVGQDEKGRWRAREISVV